MLILIFLSINYELLFSGLFYGKLYAESFYDSPLIIFTSISIFVFIMKNVKLKYNLYIEQLSELTMGIYIIHPTVIKILKKIITYSNFFTNIIILILTIIISIIITSIINKIPKINKLIKL